MLPLRITAGASRPEDSLLPDDPRWVLAARAASLLEGGRAALLTPDRRRRLMGLADRMGLRPFDAALVIAIVQDAARTGTGSVPCSVADRLRMVGGAPPANHASRVPLQLMLSLLLGVAGFLLALRWLNQA